jgi:ABC-type Fe3+-siderophore transport system permease subunit
MPTRVSTNALFLLAALLALALYTLSHGQISLSWAEALAALWGSGADEMTRQIVLDIRLPRVLAAVLAGSALGVAGVLMQALFRNPVADSWSLGLLAGGQLGVALTVTAAAFAGPAAVSFLTIFAGPSITRLMALGGTVLLVAPVVAFCGPVSFIGLIVPHFARSRGPSASCHSYRFQRLVERCSRWRATRSSTRRGSSTSSTSMPFLRSSAHRSSSSSLRSREPSGDGADAHAANALRRL